MLAEKRDGQVACFRAVHGTRQQGDVFERLLIAAHRPLVLGSAVSEIEDWEWQYTPSLSANLCDAEQAFQGERIEFAHPRDPPTIAP